MNIPEKATKASDYITELCKGYETQIENLKKENEFFNNFAPAEKFLPYEYNSDKNRVLRNYWDKFDKKHLGPDYYENNKPLFIKENWTTERLEKLLKEDAETAKKNEEISARNLEKRKKIFNLFLRLGMTEHKYIRKNARSLNTVKVQSEWVTELNIQFPALSSFYDIERIYKDKIQHIRDYEYAKQQYLDAQQKIKDDELKNKKISAQLIELNLKYKLNIPLENLENYEVLTKLLEQNKYLYLGHYLSKNRGDWNDGYSYAQTGLRFFDSKKSMDLNGINDDEISNDIQSHISNWDGDGRIFRDCKYNYGILFKIVQEQNPELYEDYSKLATLTGDY